VSELVFVGTSDAFGAGGRRQSAILLRTPSGTVLVDCGATTGSGLSALGIPRQEIDAILVSHFHADHFGGIPLLVLAAIYEDRRRRPLCIAGPRDVEARVRSAARALGHPLDGRELPFALRFVEVEADVATEVGPVQVTPFPTRHQPEAHPHGFVVQWASTRKLVFSGDTGWFDELPRRAAGAEVFVCECTQLRRALDFHLSLDELLEHRAAFDCGRILLTHLGEAMSQRRGRCELETADDGLVVPL
jgi:ribonuclease BN (tRNA processing enzyme)